MGGGSAARGEVAVYMARLRVLCDREQSEQAVLYTRDRAFCDRKLFS